MKAKLLFVMVLVLVGLMSLVSKASAVSTPRVAVVNSIASTDGIALVPVTLEQNGNDITNVVVSLKYNEATAVLEDVITNVPDSIVNVEYNEGSATISLSSSTIDTGTILTLYFSQVTKYTSIQFEAMPQTNVGNASFTNGSVDTVKTIIIEIHDVFLPMLPNG